MYQSAVCELVIRKVLQVRRGLSKLLKQTVNNCYLPENNSDGEEDLRRGAYSRHIEFVRQIDSSLQLTPLFFFSQSCAFWNEP